MGKNGLSATEIGAPLGLNGRVTNWLLEAARIIEGTPGAWDFTEKGAAYRAHVNHDNGYGGFAFRQWDTMHFEPKIIDDLDVALDLIAKACEVDAALLAEQTLERARSRAEPEDLFRVFQEQQAAANTRAQIDWAKVALLTASVNPVGGGVIVIRKYGTDIKRKWGDGCGAADRSREAEADARSKPRDRRPRRDGIVVSSQKERERRHVIQS